MPSGKGTVKGPELGVNYPRVQKKERGSETASCGKVGWGGEGDWGRTQHRVVMPLEEFEGKDSLGKLGEGAACLTFTTVGRLRTGIADRVCRTGGGVEHNRG